MNKQKEKGIRFEREVVAKLIELGHKAERARGSDGRALGRDQTVDVVIDDLICASCKVRATIANYLMPPKGCDIVVFKQDRGPIMAALPLEDYLELRRQATWT